MKTVPEWPLESQGDEFDLDRIVGTFRRHWLLLAATVVLGTAAAGVIATQLSPRYTASATLLIEPQQLRILDTANFADSAASWQAGVEVPLATQVNILSSRGHAERVVNQLDLVAVDEFQPQPGMRERFTLGAVLDQVQRLGVMVGLAEANDDPASPARPTAPPSPAELQRHAIEHLLDNLDVHRDGQSQALVIRYTAGEAERAATVANALVESYLADQVDKKVGSVASAERWVRQRIATLREELLVAEREIERFRAANNLMESRDGTFETQQLVSLNNQLIAVQAERRAAEARLARLRDIRARGGNQAVVGEIASSPLAINLRQQVADLQRLETQLAQEFGPQHPRMVQVRVERQEVERRLDDEVARIMVGIADEVALVTERERSIEAGLGEARGYSAMSQQSAVQLRELERDAAARRSLYETMLARQQELQEQRDLLRPDARIISSAVVPERPSFPRLGVMLVVGFVGSFGLGVILVAIAELRDRSLRGSRQVAKALGLPTLALVPAIGGLARDATPTRYLIEQPDSAYGEALRELEAMQRVGGGAGSGGQVVLVTSSLPGEGKTSLAAGLALTAAAAGRRTILVDLDLRHPSVEQALGVTEGQTSTLPMLDLLVLGDAKGRSGRPQLVHSTTLRQLTERLRNSYDVVVIDSPPVLGLADAKVLTQMADQVLFVVRWGETPAAAARAALQSLESVGARVNGVVLNRVDLERHARYGYGDAGSYYHSYRRYYAQ